MPEIEVKKVSTAPAEQAKIAALAKQLSHANIEIARAAQRELWRIVRHVGRPGAQNDKRAVVTELETLLKEEQPAAITREALWMLSEIGTADSVEAIAVLLSNETAREDARMALERIPGEESMAALKSALDTAPDDFKVNLAQSLRARGALISGHPCEKLKPTKRSAERNRKVDQP